MTPSSKEAKPRITRDDIEAKLRDIAGPVEDNVERAQSMAVAVGVAVGAVLVITAYVLGRRRGRKRTPVVEIRRVVGRIGHRMESIVNRIFRAGVRRGVGGSQPWMVVAVVAGTVRVLRRVASPKPEVVWRQAMRPGDRFEIAVSDAPPTRRQRRRAKGRAEKAAREAQVACAP